MATPLSLATIGLGKSSSANTIRLESVGSTAPGFSILGSIHSSVSPPALKALPRQACGFAEARYELLIRPGPRMGEAAGALADCVAGLPAKAAAATSSKDGP